MTKIKDVAAHAGVSTATVSRVLNDHPRVDPVLAERVRAAAAELGYRTNGVARSLRRQRADVWALIISDIGNPFFTSVARGVEDVAQRAGYSVVLCNSDENPAKEARYVDVAERERVSGVILSPNARGSDLAPLTRANIPVVAVDRTMRGTDAVLVDSRGGARAATEHLFDCGWTRPACVTGPEGTGTADERLAGYEEAVLAHGRRAARPLVRRGDFRAETAREGVASLLDERRPPDAFFVANSPMALGALDEFRRRGLRPGRDVGLIAFDDAPWARFVDPPMSVVAQPGYEMGASAGELLLARIAGTAPVRRRRIVLDTELIVRASSRH